MFFRLVLSLLLCINLVTPIPDDVLDAAKSKEDWLSMRKNVLVLKCQTLGLPSDGDNEVLAERLVEHFTFRIESETAPTDVMTTEQQECSAPNDAPSISDQSQSPIRGRSSKGKERKRKRESAVNNVNTVNTSSNITYFTRDELRNLMRDTISNYVDHRATTADVAVCSYSAVPQNNHLYQNSILPRQQSFPRRSGYDDDQDVFGDQSENEFGEEIITENGVALPPLPRNIISDIRSGKFVNFDKLLPFSTNPDVKDGLSLLPGRNGGFILQPKNDNRAKVVDFYSWSLAWSVFVLYFTYFHPHRYLELLGYHNRASELASQYAWAEFQTYDRQFRLRMAQSVSLRWDRIDEDLKARFLRTSRVMCYICNNFGHMAPQCPTRFFNVVSQRRVNSSSLSSFTRPSSFATSTRPVIPQGVVRSRFHTSNTNQNVNSSITNNLDNSAPVCFWFNKGACNRSNCRFRHICIHCGAPNHSALHCPSRFSS